MILGQIFAVIQLILKLIGLWDQFISWSDKKRIADAEKNTAERNKAVEDEKNAKSEEDFDNAQSGVVKHKP